MADKDKNKTIRENATIREKNVRAGNVARVDQFEVVRKLGAGGFGSVYLAKDTVSGVDVALKVVGHGVDANVTFDEKKVRAGAVDELRENFRLVQELSHDNIATAYPLHPVKEVEVALGETDAFDVRSGDVLAVLKFAPGITLDRWRKMFRGESVPFKDALEIVSQIASALDYAHGKGIVHRDIKPSNVMIETRSGQSPKARLLDFGLAVAAGGSGARGEICGTPGYMSPEQWTGETQDARTDQYALAVMTCELLTGHVPYEAAFQSGDEEVMRTAVTERDVDLPEGLSMRQRTALVRALAKTPGERFSTCAEFVQAMRSASRPRRMALVAGGVLAVLAVLAVILMKRPQDTVPSQPSQQVPVQGPVVAVPVAEPASEKTDVQTPPQPVSERVRPVQETEPKPQPKPVLAPKPVERVAPPPARPVKSVWRGFAGQDKRRYASLKRSLTDSALSRYVNGQSLYTDEEWRAREPLINEMKSALRELEQAIQDRDKDLSKEKLEYCIGLYEKYADAYQKGKE